MGFVQMVRIGEDAVIIRVNLCRSVDEMPHDGATLKVTRPHLQIPPHEKLCEGKVADIRVFQNFPTIDGNDGLPELSQNQ